MHREFEKSPGPDWLENLRRSRAVSHGIVVAGRGVVLETRFFQYSRRRSVEAQPMHAHAQPRFATGLGEPAMFFPAFVRVVPCVDSMDAGFMPHLREVLN